MTDANATEKEARLVKIVRRLEQKIKTIWDENKRLTHGLELANIDLQIAQEQTESLSHELGVARKRLAELEELNELSEELESTYITEKQRLEIEIQSLQTRLNESESSTQAFEDLQLELNDSQRLLKVLELELAIVKRGLLPSLAPLLNKPLDSADLYWLDLVEAMNLSVDTSFANYKRGNATIQQFVEQLSLELDTFLKQPRVLENASTIQEIEREKPHYHADLRWRTVFKRVNDQVSAKNQHLVENEAGNPIEAQDSRITDELRHTNELLEHRVQVLQSKLVSAESVSREVETLRAWQHEARTRESQFKTEISRLESALTTKESEIKQLNRQNLPFELQAAQHAMQVSSLHSAIAFLTSKQNSFNLDPIDLESCKPQVVLSKLAGNKRVRNLRRLALTFELGGDAKTAAKLAIEQEVHLQFL